jgi:hypothetical protein
MLFRLGMCMLLQSVWSMEDDEKHDILSTVVVVSVLACPLHVKLPWSCACSQITTLVFFIWIGSSWLGFSCFTCSIFAVDNKWEPSILSWWKSICSMKIPEKNAWCAFSHNHQVFMYHFYCLVLQQPVATSFVEISMHDPFVHFSVWFPYLMQAEAPYTRWQFILFFSFSPLFISTFPAPMDLIPSLT